MDSHTDKKNLSSTAKWLARKKQMAASFGSLSQAEKLHYIPYPGEFSEFEVQAHLLQKISEMGLDIRGNIQSRCATCFFDLVVYIDRIPVRIIETKRGKPKVSKKAHAIRVFREREKQLERYRQFGVPVDLVVAMREADIYIRQLAGQGIMGMKWDRKPG